MRTRSIFEEEVLVQKLTEVRGVVPLENACCVDTAHASPYLVSDGQ